MEREVLKPTVTIFLEEREPKNDGTIPLKIRITWKRKRKYFAIRRNYMEALLRKNSLSEFIFKGKGEYSIDKELFMKATGADGKKPHGKYKQLLQVFNDTETDAKRIAEQCTPQFSFDLFQELYYGSSTSFNNNLFHYFESHIKAKRDNDNVRTAVSYECTMNSLKKFHKKQSLPFESITISFLEKYEKWMKETGASGKGNSRTTIGINMRQLRTIFNKRPKELDELPYPFGEKKYQIPNSRGRKIALDTADLKKVFTYKPKVGSLEEYYLDFWKLQYLMNGINITDLLLLRYENIQDGFITFERHKTERTKKDSEPIRIPYSENIKLFFEKYSQPRKTDKTFVFPIVNNKMTPVEKDKAIQYFSNMVTKRIKKVARILEFDGEVIKKISSYASRHTFASMLMKKNAPAPYIKQQLGHASLDTTANYLSSFEDKHLQEWQKKLTEF